MAPKSQLIWLLLGYWGHTSLATNPHPYFESITAQNTLGSHFGVPTFNATYDYVVVGGGTAGLTLATRLAEDGRYSVAVIEAGGFSDFDNGNLSSVPGNAAYYIGAEPLTRNPLIDWEIYTEDVPVRLHLLTLHLLALFLFVFFSFCLSLFDTLVFFCCRQDWTFGF